MTILRLILHDELGRPKLTSKLVDSLLHSLQFASSATLVTIEGSPTAFCEGLDLDLLASGNREECEGVLALYGELLRGLDEAPRPVVALVDGPALGGGVGLAAVADLALATPRASFGLPEVLLGVIPAVVFPTIARRVGVHRARILALGGQPLDAARALEWGLVDEVTDDLEASLGRHIRRLARMDRNAVGVMKALVAEHFATSDSNGTFRTPGGREKDLVLDDYRADAVARFGVLVSSASTQARLARFIQGDPPWLEESLP